MGHRRFLPLSDKMRHQKACFDGKKDLRVAPPLLDGEMVLQQFNAVREVQFGKLSCTRKRKRSECELNWTKKSIFFCLPYWSSNKLRHWLDVMNIEKNICDNLLGTLMGVVGKTKDTVESREDLKIMGVCRDLHLIPNPNGGSSMPTACFTFSKTKNKVFCNWLNSVKFPDGFASNISSCVDVTDCKLSGLKSHDCHILIQRLLLVAVRGLLTKKVSTCIIELCTFFRALCARTVSVKVVEQLQKDIFKILCKMETIFPPSFSQLWFIWQSICHGRCYLEDQCMAAGCTLVRDILGYESVVLRTWHAPMVPLLEHTSIWNVCLIVVSTWMS